MANQGPQQNSRAPGQFPDGQRPHPPPGFHPQPGFRPGHPGGPMNNMPFPPNIRQQSCRIRDISTLTEADCLKKLTLYAAYSLRKAPASFPGEKLSWEKAEVTDEHLDQIDIKKTINKLNKRGRSVTAKRQALRQSQQNQVSGLLDEHAFKELDRNFEWSLVQIDRREKLVPSSRRGKKPSRETVVINAYLKRAPVPGINVVMLYQEIEKARFDSLRPPPPHQTQPREQREQNPPNPHQHDQRPPSAIKRGGPEPGFVDLNKGRPKSPKAMKAGGPEPGFVDLGKGRPKSPKTMKKDVQEPRFAKVGKGRSKSPKFRHKTRRYHESDGSSSSSRSGSSSTDDSSSGSDWDSPATSLSSVPKAKNTHRRRHSQASIRSHSKPRQRMSPEPRLSEAYGVPQYPSPPPQLHQQSLHHVQPQFQPQFQPQQQYPQPQQQHPQIHQQIPHVPDPPRIVPDMDHHINSAYQAGKQEGKLETPPIIIERIIERPHIERVIERPPIEHVIESPGRVISYTSLPERPRFSEPRYTEERYVGEIRREDDDYLIRRREVEDKAILREQRMRQNPEDYIERRERPEFLGRSQAYSMREGRSPSLSPTREYFDPRPSDLRERSFRRPEARRVFTTPIIPHPFAPVPRRYPPSSTTTEAGW